MVISFNLFNLKKQLEMALGEELSWAHIARATGLHRNTIERVASNQTERVDLETLAALLSFFRAHKMNVGIADLLIVEIDPPGDTT